MKRESQRGIIDVTELVGEQPLSNGNSGSADAEARERHGIGRISREIRHILSSLRYNPAKSGREALDQFERQRREITRRA